jgi:hypothetical protein
MTTQEAYEQIKAFFSLPGAQLSQDTSHLCYYRHPDNPRIRCAVGCLIPDDLYKREKEGVSASGVMEKFELPLLDDVNPEFLDEVQRMHDEANTGGEFLASLADFGGAFLPMVRS